MNLFDPYTTDFRISSGSPYPPSPPRLTDVYQRSARLRIRHARQQRHADRIDVERLEAWAKGDLARANRLAVWAGVLQRRADRTAGMLTNLESLARRLRRHG